MGETPNFHDFYEVGEVIGRYGNNSLFQIILPSTQIDLKDFTSLLPV